MARCLVLVRSLLQTGACTIVRHFNVCCFSHVTKHGDGVFGTTICWIGRVLLSIGLDWIGHSVEGRLYPGLEDHCLFLTGDATIG